jgi:hypothetical protein
MAGFVRMVVGCIDERIRSSIRYFVEPGTVLGALG